MSSSKCRLIRLRCLAICGSCLILCGFSVRAMPGAAPAADPPVEAAPQHGRPGPASAPVLPPIDARRLAALARFNRGAALMEQYRYSEAAKDFEQVLAEAPDWTAARFNLGLAYLNMQGAEGAEAHLDLARTIFEKMLDESPQNPYAHFCLGLLFEHLGKAEPALRHFEAVAKVDPRNPHVLYKYGQALLAAGRQDEGIAKLEEAIAADPGFVSAVYALALQYQRKGLRDKALPLFARFKELNDAEMTGGSFTVRKVYGSAGKYYEVLGPDSLPLPRREAARPSAIVFSPETRSLGAATAAWRYDGGTVARPAAACGDLDGDGDLDLCLAGLGENGACSIFLNDGKGNFRRGDEVATQVVSLSLGDVDNDGDLDLWLGRAGAPLLLLSDGAGKFSPFDLGASAAPSGVTACARLVDVDSDGDLDCLAFRLAAGSLPGTEAPLPAASLVLNNNRNGSFEDIADRLGLRLGDYPVGTVVHDDFDNDRDLDMMIFPAGAEGPIAWVNDRVWRRHELPAAATGISASRVAGATPGDPNKDGFEDLVVFSPAGVELYWNQGQFRFHRDEAFAARFARLGGTTGQFADIDNDGDLDLVIADARRGGSRGPVVLLNRGQGEFVDAAEVDPGLMLAAVETPGDAGCLVADFTGDGRCDLLLLPVGASPLLIENVTPGGHWVEFDLQGVQRQDNKGRSNRSAIGARVEVKSGTVIQQFTVGVPAGPGIAPPLRVHAGLGAFEKVDWLRIFWPDAVLQAELELPGNQVTLIEELPRKTSSCPVLFAWDGQRYRCVSDFGGVGGLGFFLSPGCYAPPDPTEYLPIPRLAPQDGEYVLQVLEPLEEIVYFDEAKLVAVDHPAGTEVWPHEMMAVASPPPAFELFCSREKIEPVRAVDAQGRDVTAQLSKVDRQYAGAGKLDARFLGFAEPHFVELDFGDRLAGLAGDARLVMHLFGWVEYGYSSTNFAAWQAGEQFRAPTIEVEREGRWVDVLEEVGYPAGIEHVMTVDVTGAIRPGDRKVRISTNMEIYWDRIYLAACKDEPLSVREIPVASAQLDYFGYPREYSPDGRLPNLYDYHNVDRAMGWKLMEGDYTRFGEVGELLGEADDCYVIMGRGERLTLRFPVEAFGPVPEGRRRTFLLKTDSYCKDMDLYTAFPDTVEPLPFHGMSGYPYAKNEHYPDTEKTRAYRATYNTRRIGSGMGGAGR